MLPTISPGLLKYNLSFYKHRTYKSKYGEIFNDLENIFNKKSRVFSGVIVKYIDFGTLTRLQ